MPHDTASRYQVRITGDPTAHAVIVTLREAASRLGRTSLHGLTVFSVIEPCAMCVGALLQSDTDGLVYAMPDPVDGACGSAFPFLPRLLLERFPAGRFATERLALAAAFA